MNLYITHHLMREEGLRLSAYQDHLGYWTIGHGRLIDERRGGGISKSEAQILLENDIERVEGHLEAELSDIWPRLSEVRRAVLLSMAFQLGVVGLLRFKRFLQSTRATNYDLAAAQMLESKWARQTPARALRLSTAFRTNDPSIL